MLPVRDMNRKTLQVAVKNFLIREGRGAKERLAVASGVSVRTIDQITSKAHLPRPANILGILKAMGEPIPPGLFVRENETF